MTQIIKCHLCKLDKGSCNDICMEVDDITTLYREGATEDKPFVNRYCTAYRCSNNPTGVKCERDKCVFGRMKDKK